MVRWSPGGPRENRMACPDLEQLERFHGGDLSGEERETLRRHVEGCAACRATLEEIEANDRLSARVRAIGAPPTRIGSFRVLEELGRGGMGVVYLAEQDHPRRLVALKVVHGTLLSEEIRARFEREANLLGTLRHPGIASIYEAGTAEVETPGGAVQRVPYLAMERVEGIELGRFVRERDPAPRERIELLARICDAVHHAHVNGIIHRDLKPSNILIEEASEEKADLHPRILDFGVARAIDRKGRGMTLRTEVGRIVGTLQFMSPEQVAGDSTHVDTRSDVYALGVLGYFLLAGEMPYDLRDAGLEESIRSIRSDLPRPLGAVAPRYRGDVETIVGKCLEKDPARRYQSASEIAADLRRHLTDEPITARPPSTTYQLRKLVSRRRGAFAAVGIVVALLVVFGVVMSVLYQRARTAEHRATVEAESARAVSDYLSGLFAQSDPRETLSENPSAREILDRGSERIRSELADQPEIQARLLREIGRAYRGLGDYEAALRSWEEALLLDAGREDGPSVAVARDLRLTGTAYDDLGLPDSAENRYRRSLALLRDMAGAHAAERAATLSHLAGFLREWGDLEEAAALAREALEIQVDAHGEEHVESAFALSALAGIEAAQGHLEAADRRYRETIGILETTYGEEHPEVAVELGNLAALQMDRRRYAAAESLFRRVLAIKQKTLGEDHPTLAVSLNNLSAALYMQGRYPETEVMLRRAIGLSRRQFGEEHPSVIGRLKRLGQLLDKQGKHTEADSVLRRVLVVRRRQLPEGDWRLAETESVHGGVLVELGRYAEAERKLLSAYEVIRAARGEGDRFTESARDRIVTLYEKWGRPERAAAYTTRFK
ncbi:MAG: tetratricopeptide repeat protein [Candidatus Eisenbacteria bacterium]|nr:tetratricopeptide repeat protein [Candidatus Latescibacterota bacterium]MBD3302617.1 tetratricopeptide repeat protein [Candidatus Eisenbacteria bacterium]